jgi:BolA protein
VSRKQEIENLLQESYTPLFLEVNDESNMHSVPEGSESHFKVTLVSDRFESKPLVQRHRAVNGSLAELLAGGIHALALHTMTPEEWFAKGGIAPDSPPCLGGSKK